MKKNTGLTLLELLVATAIAVCISGGLFVIRVQFLDSVRESFKNGQKLTKIKKIQSALYHDFQNCISLRRIDSSDENQFHGFKGNNDQIIFNTFNKYGDNPFGRTQKRCFYEVTYYIEESSVDASSLDLFRKVLVNGGKENTEKIVGKIESADFQYFDGKEWSISWNKKYIPRAVKLSLSLLNYDNELNQFSIMFDVPCGGEK